MGVVSGAYGTRGWIKVRPWSGERAALVQYPRWWVGGAGRDVERARLHGAQVIAKLAGFETPEAARLLKGERVCIARDALPEPDPGQYYFADLLGMEVVNEQGERLGVVQDMSSHGAQDVMEVAGERVRLLPWVSAVVKRVDLEARRIEVDWGTDW